MTSLGLNPINLLSTSGNYPERGPVRRLMVLVPVEIDHTMVARRVWELAYTLGCHILFLSLCEDIAQEASLRRKLIMMSAMVQDGNVFAEGRVEVGTNWVCAVQSSLQADDMILCLLEQRTGLLQKPLHQILKTNVNVPIYVFSDVRPPKSKQNWISPILPWIGFLAIITGFGFLQVEITQLSGGWFQTVLLLVSTLNEIWLIWVWNRLYD